MKTEKLYDHYRTFETDATVLAVTPEKEGFGVVFDKTVFFPGGGGQNADPGTVNGAPVLAVFPRDEAVVHVLAAAPAVGDVCRLRIDEDKRLRDAELHTGEHMLSGTAYTLFGVKNVGFHMGADFCTADFDRILTAEELARLETAVNNAIRMDIPVEITYPTAEELAACWLRKKPETDEPLRVVRIGEVDICACCGTHTETTGQVGLLSILGADKVRGGSRVKFLCGKQALDRLSYEHAVLTEACASLSASPEDLTARLEKKNADLAAMNRKCTDLLARLAAATAKTLVSENRDDNGELTINGRIDDGELLLPLAEALEAYHPAHGLLLAGTRYILFKTADSAFDLQQENRRLRSLGARGGGKDRVIAGVVPEDFSEQA